jgi:hypothetical protein
MLMVRATPDSEKGTPPDVELITTMMKFNEEMVNAGVMLAGDGLHPSSKGARIHFSGGKRTVIDGPFAESKELIAGFWILQVRSKEEALEWAKRCPAPFPTDCDLELRQIVEMEDFGAPAELIQKEAEMRATVEARQKRQ